jgi:hypothetical protein
MITGEQAMYFARASVRDDSDYLSRVAKELITRATLASTTATDLVLASNQLLTSRCPTRAASQVPRSAG